MTKSSQALVLTSLALVCFLCTPTQAQERERKYRFEFFGGASVPMDKDFEIGAPQSNTIIPGTHTFSPGAQGGVRLGMDGARYWGMDYAYSFGANAGKISTQYGSFSVTNRIHQASSNVLFYPWSLDRKSCFPYVTAGLGATFVVLKQEAITESLTSAGGIGPIQSETIFAFNAGFGVRYRLSPRVGIRFDVRDYMSRGFRYGLPKSSSNASEAVLPIGGILHQVAGTVGIVLHF